jgi:hypothetical protein
MRDNEWVRLLVCITSLANTAECSVSLRGAASRRSGAPLPHVERRYWRKSFSRWTCECAEQAIRLRIRLEND